ncbi:hypothetical protein GZ77_21575 [Endozoicomonas montiporae]|uniref:Glutamyl-tRNA synthetase n=2 Tax=Endozoicomonas montiporae TaxID=1027273 RepID=A0A081N3I8_9GAMM|nr:DUF4202 domain-containing protein [Endozoicomonas montiporae]AMO58318.1 hypothetical protein EZMO1_4402 [Endozoicomonas montiporae CL-33]KEQ13011.1 hypothetical protein GZ77_21575 [Endozoicomonas montiporae]
MIPLQQTLATIDSLHAEDPTTTAGKPTELLYAERMTGWLNRLAPDASEELQIAVRSQHLCRWQIPRSDYPAGRTGYLQWRSELGKMHAETATQVMQKYGYDKTSQKKAYSLIRKLNLKRNEETQTLEDCACLVFLEFEFSAFAIKHTEDKLISIVQKTWGKMSAQAQQKALELNYGSKELALVGKALKPVEAS